VNGAEQCRLRDDCLGLLKSMGESSGSGVDGRVAFLDHLGIIKYL